MRERTLGGLFVLVAAVGFGTLAIFGKLAERTGLARPTLLILRFAIGAAIVWAVLAVRGEAKLLRGRLLVAMLGLGVVYGFLTISYFWGLSFLTAGLTGIIFYTYPVHVVALSALFLDDRLTLRLVVGLVLSLGGVVLVIGVGRVDPNLFGVALVLTAALGVAVYMVAGRALTADTSPRLLVAHALLAAAGTLAVRWLVAGAPLPRTSAHAGIALGIGLFGTAIPMLLLYEGLSRISANHASVLGTAEPVATVALGVLVLGESLSPTTLVGGLLVLTGVLLVQLDPRDGTVDSVESPS
ncbi:EamA family transporter [Halobacteriales archaeon QS_1_68_17]|nr:MAG: EamA family transporter [Halobacteriales archaeon QS_1_68_17]